MASRAREGLEQEIAVRTHDLKTTLMQLREANEILARRERLAMLGQLSGGVGHELRNPLGVMSNALYYLKTILADAPANVREYLDMIQQQLAMSEKIVGDLLDFACARPPRRQPTSLGEVVESLLERIGLSHEVRVTLDIPDDLPPVLADSSHVRRSWSIS